MGQPATLLLQKEFLLGIDSGLKVVWYGTDVLEAAGGEAVEGCPRSCRVRTHVGHEEPFTDRQLWEELTLQNTVKTVACRAVNCRHMQPGFAVGLE